MQNIFYWSNVSEATLRNKKDEITEINAEVLINKKKHNKTKNTFCGMHRYNNFMSVMALTVPLMSKWINATTKLAEVTIISHNFKKMESTNYLRFWKLYVNDT